MVIDFHWCKTLKGMLVTRVSLETVPEKKAWLNFLTKYKMFDIFMSPTNIDIIKNHIEFFGTFGKLKVYKYVRR